MTLILWLFKSGCYIRYGVVMTSNHQITQKGLKRYESFFNLLGVKKQADES